MTREKALEIIGRKHHLREIDTSIWSDLKINGMKFKIKAYEAEGLGHVSIMEAKAPLSIMTMFSLIIVPSSLDKPLYSHDTIKAGGKTTLIIELYDTTLKSYDASSLSAVKEKYSTLEKRDPGENWYDRIKLKESISLRTKDRESISHLEEEYLEAFVESKAETLTSLDKKKEKIDFYVDNLIKRGGVSTDVFKKKLGEEKTRALFETVLFGNRREQCSK